MGLCYFFPFLYGGKVFVGIAAKKDVLRVKPKVVISRVKKADGKAQGSINRARVVAPAVQTTSGQYV
jgi:hypothetical protein